MVEAAVLVNERLSGELQQAITALSWSPGGEFLAIASAGGELLLLDFPAGCEELLCGNSDESLSAIGFSADCCFLMAVGQASCLLLRKLHSQPPLSLSTTQDKSLPRHPNIPGLKDHCVCFLVVHASRRCYGGGWLGYDAVVPAATRNNSTYDDAFSTDRDVAACEGLTKERRGARQG